jgi:hypothetical protein
MSAIGKIQETEKEGDRSNEPGRGEQAEKFLTHEEIRIAPKREEGEEELVSVANVRVEFAGMATLPVKTRPA